MNLGHRNRHLMHESWLAPFCIAIIKLEKKLLAQSAAFPGVVCIPSMRELSTLMLRLATRKPFFTFTMGARGTRIVAAVAALGNLLQGWDSAAIAGALLYIKPEFNLENSPLLEGSIVAMTLVGATASTAVAGPGADWLGRRTALCVSAVLYSIGALLMTWSPTVFVLMMARLTVGFGIGLAVTIVPLFISESAPAEIRGELNTLPQLAGSGGMFLSYCMGFCWSLRSTVDWRIMLGILLIPSVIYLGLCIFYLPESPRWLVSKGEMLKAKKVLQQLRNREDVAGEMALLVEGLGVGEGTFLEEYVIQPVQDIMEDVTKDSDNSQIKLFGPEEGISWIAKPLASVAGSEGFLSRRSSMAPRSTPLLHSVPLMDPMVTLIGSLRASTVEHLPEVGSQQCKMLDHHCDFSEDVKNDDWDEESVQLGCATDDYYSDDEMVGQLDENLTSPLLSKHFKTHWEAPPVLRSDNVTYSPVNSVSRNNSVLRINSKERNSIISMATHGSPPPNSLAESFGSTGIGGGWQLAWRWTGREGTEGKPEEGSFKRMYLLQEGSAEQSHVASAPSLPRLSSRGAELEPIHAAALVSQPSQYGKEIFGLDMVGPATMHPAETATRGPAWSGILEGGVKRALVVGVTLQILEQFAGINAVLYFTPQILQQSGAEILLARAGFGSNSASLLASALSALLMLPCIVVAMRVMDVMGRRKILLSTLPVLIFSLMALVIINLVSTTVVAFATVSIGGVVLYICFFVMGFGPIPGILCSEIFPTRVRGMCIGICQAAMWICNIIVTELFPILNKYMGIAGAFALFAVFCVVSWFFVFLKVPETKGMPLEVIAEFFAMSAAEANKRNDEDGGNFQNQGQ